MNDDRNSEYPGGDYYWHTAIAALAKNDVGHKKEQVPECLNYTDGNFKNIKNILQ